MAYEMKDNSGSLFKNDRKESENHPDYTGSCLIGGVEMWMSAWIKKKEGAKTYMSFAFKPKDKPAEARAPATRAPAKRLQDMDDDIPW